MLPRVVMSNAVSVDGRIDGFAADLGQYYGLTGSWHLAAHLIGSTTALASGLVGKAGDPDLPGVAPSRDPSDTRALLVVPDSRGRCRNLHVVRQQPYWRDVVVLISRSTPAAFRDHLVRTQIEWIEAGEDQVDLRQALIALNERYGVESVHLDSGGSLNGAMLRAGLVNEVNLLVHPELVGSIPAATIFGGSARADPCVPVKAELLGCEVLEHGVVWLRYAVTGSQ